VLITRRVVAAAVSKDTVTNLGFLPSDKVLKVVNTLLMVFALGPHTRQGIGWQLFVSEELNYLCLIALA
jgi:hypothetical protein